MILAVFLSLLLSIPSAQEAYSGKCEGDTVDGVKQGYWKCYYEDGTLREEGNYKDGNKTGHWKFYHTTGTVAMEGDYQNNQESGTWTVYDESGNPIDTIAY